MPELAEPLARLIQECKRLPGIGQKSAQRIASDVIGKPVRVRIEVGEGVKAASAPVSEASAIGETELRARALSHPGVKRFQELFPGAQVRTVRNLNE